MIYVKHTIVIYYLLFIFYQRYLEITMVNCLVIFFIKFFMSKGKIFSRQIICGYIKISELMRIHVK